MKIKTYNLNAKEGPKENRLEIKKKPSDYLIYTISRILQISKLKSAETKTRGERRGGGKKPWRQKGTGRARAAALPSLR